MNSRWKHIARHKSPTYCKVFFLVPTTQGCALRKIEGSPVLWTCEIQCAQHMISMKKKDFLVAREQKLGATDHRALLEHSLAHFILLFISPISASVSNPSNTPPLLPHMFIGSHWKVTSWPPNFPCYQIVRLDCQLIKKIFASNVQDFRGRWIVSDHWGVLQIMLKKLRVDFLAY